MKSHRMCCRFFLGLLVLALAGCSNSGSEPEKLRAGAFHLTWLKGLRKDLSKADLDNAAKIQQTSFNLGDITGTTDFYFLLENTGDRDITEITASVSDSAFTIYPQTIDLLPPAETLDLHNLDEYPLLRLTAIHGSAPQRVGNFPLMSAGLNSTMMKVTGKTVDEEGVEVAAELRAQMNVNAFLMDVILWDGPEEIDLLSSDGSVLVGGFVIPEFVKIYEVADTVRIENTGNVPVNLKIFSTGMFHTLAAGDTLTLDYGMSTHVMFKDDGYARDLSRFPEYSDGNCYIYLKW